MSIDGAHSGATDTFSEQGTCGDVFLCQGHHLVDVCFQIKRKALCPVHFYPVMNVCMYCTCLPVVVCSFMHAKCLAVPDHHLSPGRLHPSPFSPPLPWSINQIPCSTSACVIPSPEGKSCDPDLHQSTMWCFLTHPPPERNILRKKHTVSSHYFL